MKTTRNTRQIHGEAEYRDDAPTVPSHQVAPVVRFLVVNETPPDPAAFERHCRDLHIAELEDAGR